MGSGEHEFEHVPVLLKESLELLKVENQGFFVDATLGLGGHAEAILAANDGNRLLGIDQDREALEAAGKRLERFGERVRLVHANYSAIAEIIDNLGWGRPDGILADLGVSSLQFDSAGRGFSLRHDAELDMRMDANADVPTAAELLATLDEAEIADIIYRYGEERASRKIARWIVNRRNEGTARDDDAGSRRPRAAGREAEFRRSDTPGDANISGVTHRGEPRI